MMQENDVQEVKLVTAVDKDMATLYAKMAQVMGEVGSVSRDGTNDFFKYKFQRSDDVYNAVRVAMAKYKIAFFASMVDVHQESGQDSKGKPQTTTRATFQFTLACGDTGATLTSLWLAEAVDNSDKGINKVATAATKYFLLKTFLIGDPGETDPDAESPERAAKLSTQAVRDGLGNRGTERRINTAPASNGEPSDIKPYVLNDVIAETSFMYKARTHAINSINGMINRGEIKPDDTQRAAIWKVFEHRTKSDDYQLTMEQVCEALTIARDSAVPVGSVRQWIIDGGTLPEAWEAVVAYHENANLEPAKPAKSEATETLPAESDENDVPF